MHTRTTGSTRAPDTTFDVADPTDEEGEPEEDAPETAEDTTALVSSVSEVRGEPAETDNPLMLSVSRRSRVSGEDTCPSPWQLCRMEGGGIGWCTVAVHAGALQVRA